MPIQQPQLYCIPREMLRDLADVTAAYQFDADGGYVPLAPADQGDLTVSCPWCGEVLVHDVCADAVERGLFRCNTCHEGSRGSRYLESRAAV